jgi:hypothetical protein
MSWTASAQPRLARARRNGAPIRPITDAHVLALVTHRTFSQEDFAETRQGACRLTSGLARMAATANTRRQHIAPVSEAIAHTLADHAAGRSRSARP